MPGYPSGSHHLKVDQQVLGADQAHRAVGSLQFVERCSGGSIMTRHSVPEIRHAEKVNLLIGFGDS
jgi:hypothetical protein